MRFTILPFQQCCALLGFAVMVSCSEKETPTYRVARDEPEAAPAMEGEKVARPLRWHAPDEWQEQTPGQFQTALYRIAPGITVSVSSFPGDGGGMAANVNRWRKQVGLEPSAEVGGEIIALEEGGPQARWFDLRGAEQSILAAIIPLDSETWFFKFNSPTVAVETARPGFDRLLKSIEIGSKTTQPPAPGKPRIKLDVPEGWEKSEGEAVRAASFTIPATDGIPGDVSVIPVPGDGGTTLENVNLWRAQLRLPPLEKDDDPALGETSGNIIFTHMVSDQPLFSRDRHGAITTAIVRAGEVTWFFKMAGEAETISRNREVFEEFVRSAAFR
jgi:hypothetical protein